MFNSKPLIIRDRYLKNEAYIADSGLKEAHNQVIFLFSPTQFNLPLCDISTESGAMLDYERFHSWMQEMAALDEYFSVFCRTIRIVR